MPTPRVEAQTTCKTQANFKAFLNNRNHRNKLKLHISHENKSRCLGLNDLVVLLSALILCNATSRDNDVLEEYWRCPLTRLLGTYYRTWSHILKQFNYFSLKICHTSCSHSFRLTYITHGETTSGTCNDERKIPLQ